MFHRHLALSCKTTHMLRGKERKKKKQSESWSMSVVPENVLRLTSLSLIISAPPEGFMKASFFFCSRISFPLCPTCFRCAAQFVGLLVSAWKHQRRESSAFKRGGVAPMLRPALVLYCILQVHIFNLRSTFSKDPVLTDFPDVPSGYCRLVLHAGVPAVVCVCVFVCHNTLIKKYRLVYKKFNLARQLESSLRCCRSVSSQSLFQARRGMTGLISALWGQRGEAPSGY